MNTPDPRWQRLAAAARQVRDGRDTAAPSGFATRVAAQAFAAVEQPFSALLARFSWRALGFAALLALISVAAVAFTCFSGSRELTEDAGLDETVVAVLDIS